MADDDTPTSADKPAITVLGYPLPNAIAYALVALLFPALASYTGNKAAEADLKDGVAELRAEVSALKSSVDSRNTGLSRDIEQLADDVADVEGAVTALAAEVKAIQLGVAERTADRWTRQDHATYARDVDVRLDDLDERLDVLERARRYPIGPQPEPN